MAAIDDTRLPLALPDPTAELRSRLRDLAPHVFAEGRLDLDKLRLAVGETVEPGVERYGLGWAGKSEAFRNVQTPSVGTLLPMPEDSVAWDSTGNLIIEGDNLEVLKLLQKPYHGKVKMIYIDPPYNTGNDFIYPDNYREGLDDYLRYSGQVSEDGLKQSTNTETSGRFHSKWLSMMYPRLFLARNLLREDGVIFVSIDDNEVHNLRMLMNEVFGEENFIGIVCWKNVTDNNPTLINKDNEFILCYGRLKNCLPQSWKSLQSDAKELLQQEFRRLQKTGLDAREIQSRVRDFISDNEDLMGNLTRYKNVDEHGIFTGSESVHNPRAGGYDFEVIHPVTGRPMRKPATGYRFPEATFRKMEREGLIIHGEDEKRIVKIKKYLDEFEDTFRSVITMDGRLGTYDLKRLFSSESKVFDNPKPVALLRQILSYVTDKNSLVLDLCAGSGTVAQSVMELNKIDGGNRRFILVQLPEGTDMPSLPTIASICRERVKRFSKSMSPVNGKEVKQKDSPKQDYGFRAFRLSSSNFKIWDSETASVQSEALSEQLKLYADNIVRAREPQDVLYELILKSGLPLSSKVERIEGAGNHVWSVEGQEMMICLENPVTQDVLRGILAAGPRRILCLDVAFGGNDKLKTNAVLEAKSHNISFHTI